MSAEVVFVLPLLSPATRMVVVSDAVNSTKPSPEVMVCDDTAPASSQPSQPAVLRSELPSAVTLTSCVQRTASAPPGGGGGGGGEELPFTTRRMPVECQRLLPSSALWGKYPSYQNTIS